MWVDRRWSGTMDDRECSAAITVMQELGSRGGPVISGSLASAIF